MKDGKGTSKVKKVILITLLTLTAFELLGPLGLILIVLYFCI